jgi:S-formylglutathione hydrolase FrmB
MKQRTALPRRGLVAVAAALVGTATLVTASSIPAGAAPPTLPAPSSNGITLVSWTQVTSSEGAGVPRLIDATMTTGAIYRSGTHPQIKVRILLPANYQTDPATPYPVLYLLHGGGGGYTDWSDSGGGTVKSIVATSPFNGIVVMPEGGRAGWYSNWRGTTDGGFSPQWEDFHIRQLVPWVDANFNVVHNRSGRAIAGLSMGGTGTLEYAGRFTGTFSKVGAFSSGTDLTQPGAQQIVGDSMWLAGASIGWTGLFDGTYRVTGSTQSRMETVFGPAGANGRWDTQNPIQMAANYNAYDTKFGLYAGQNSSSSEGEQQIGQWNTAFHSRLNGAGVAHRWCTGTGTHSWGFWRQDLADFLRYAYGTTPASCPNGWGAPTP